MHHCAGLSAHSRFNYNITRSSKGTTKSHIRTHTTHALMSRHMQQSYMQLTAEIPELQTTLCPLECKITN